MRRAAIIVLDGVGIGPAHDSRAYGDGDSNTLGNVARVVGGLSLPRLEALGLGCCADIEGVPRVASPGAAYGVCEPASPGKDSTTGHWEICGLILEAPFPTFPQGFPPNLIEEFARRTLRGVLGNKPASGTAVLDEYGEAHRRSGSWIVYTSADSVFQVAAHEETVPLPELYAACTTAREICRGRYGVSRVIARPFLGEPGGWRFPWIGSDNYRERVFALAGPRRQVHQGAARVDQKNFRSDARECGRLALVNFDFEAIRNKPHHTGSFYPRNLLELRLALRKWDKENVAANVSPHDFHHL